MSKSAYDEICDPIKEWCEGNYYDDFLVTIWVGDHETTELLEFDANRFDFIWLNDWWEGEEDVRILGFAPISDIRLHNCQPRTHGDGIRAMTDDELAERMMAIDCFSCLLYEKNRCGFPWEGSKCKERILDWLKMPVEEGE